MAYYFRSGNTWVHIHVNSLEIRKPNNISYDNTSDDLDDPAGQQTRDGWMLFASVPVPHQRTIINIWE